MAYRSSAAGRAGGVRACGFTLKPTPAGQYRNRILQEYVLIHVLRGDGIFIDSMEREHPVQTGDAIHLLPNQRHGVVQNPDGQWAECWMSLSPASAAMFVAAGAIDESRPLLHPGLDAGIIEQFEQIQWDLARSPAAWTPRTLATAHAILATLCDRDQRRRLPDARTQLIEQACAALGEHLDRRIDVKTIARRAGLSYERFRKVFHQHVGLSPGEYRIRKRIDRARVLIAQRRLSNKQTAYALGYADPFTFSKQFKQIVGIPPETFRKTL